MTEDNKVRALALTQAIAAANHCAECLHGLGRYEESIAAGLYLDSLVASANDLATRIAALVPQEASVF